MENFVHTNHKSIKTPKITNNRTFLYIWGSLYFLVECPCPPCKKGTFGQGNFQVMSHTCETERIEMKTYLYVKCQIPSYTIPRKHIKT